MRSIPSSFSPRPFTDKTPGLITRKLILESRSRSEISDALDRLHLGDVALHKLVRDLGVIRECLGHSLANSGGATDEESHGGVGGFEGCIGSAGGRERWHFGVG